MRPTLTVFSVAAILHAVCKDLKGKDRSDRIASQKDLTLDKEGFRAMLKEKMMSDLEVAPYVSKYSDFIVSRLFGLLAGSDEQLTLQV